MTYNNNFLKNLEIPESEPGIFCVPSWGLTHEPCVFLFHCSIWELPFTHLVVDGQFPASCSRGKPHLHYWKRKVPAEYVNTSLQFDSERAAGCWASRKGWLKVVRKSIMAHVSPWLIIFPDPIFISSTRKCLCKQVGICDNPQEYANWKGL